MSNPQRPTVGDRPSNDPLIDEVRAIRKDLGDRFGNDVEKLAAFVRQVGDDHRRDHPLPTPTKI